MYMQQGLCEFTGKKYEDIRKDLNRDLYLTSTEAVAYGLIDKALCIEIFLSSRYRIQQAYIYPRRTAVHRA